MPLTCCAFVSSETKPTVYAPRLKDFWLCEKEASAADPTENQHFAIQSVYGFTGRIKYSVS